MYIFDAYAFLARVAQTVDKNMSMCECVSSFAAEVNIEFVWIRA